MRAPPQKKTVVFNNDSDSEDDFKPSKPMPKVSPMKAAPLPAGKKPKMSNLFGDDDDDEEDSFMPTKKIAPAPKKLPAAANARKKSLFEGNGSSDDDDLPKGPKTAA